jgi:LmbE family N-acetylglucosaminyl deacetylase
VDAMGGSGHRRVAQMIELRSPCLSEIAVLGAHCDDIAIGMGGTLLSIARANPGVRIRALILCGGGTERENEERAALPEFCPGATVDTTVLDMPDGFTPSVWDEVKNALARFRQSSDPDIVFAPHRMDAHQDHRLLAELVLTEFRDHLVLGYEIVKWDSESFMPVVFHALDTAAIQEKVRLLRVHYDSQAKRHWFDDQVFLASSRVRGVQCQRQYAEAFVVNKALITFAAK